MEDPRAAARQDAGRNCPFCRFALKASAEVVECSACSSVHHAECWNDNGGCSILGCSRAPSPTAQRPPAPPQPPAPSTPPAAAPFAAGPRPARGSRGLIAALLLTATVIAGSAAAVVLTGSGRNHATAAPAAAVVPADGTVTAAPNPPITDTTSHPTPPAPEITTTTPNPAQAPGSARDEIERVLTDYYRHVSGSDFDGAWNLLSPTYRTWKASNGGHAKWLEQERVNRDRLNPSGLRMDVSRIDGDVATIRVTGMHFRNATSSNCPFEGITWARRVDGRWLYDQGYLQNDGRAAKWRPRRTETLGYLCETSGY